MGFNTDTYSLFTDDGKFDIASIREKVDELKAKQDRVLILINDPCEPQKNGQDFIRSAWILK